MALHEPKSLKTKLMEKSHKPKGSSCRIWTGSKNRYGYGIIRFNKKTLTVQRAVMIARDNPLSSECMIVRRCGNKLCINPFHFLFLSRFEVVRYYEKIKKVKKKPNPRFTRPKVNKTYNCVICDTIISGWYTNKKYCGAACTRKGRIGVEKTCNTCGKRYNAPVGLKYRSRFCSDDCRAQSRSKHVMMHIYKSCVVHCKLCPICQKGFRGVKRGQSVRTTKCCSPECYSQYRRINGQYYAKTRPEVISRLHLKS